MNIAVSKISDIYIVPSVEFSHTHIYSFHTITPTHTQATCVLVIMVHVVYCMLASCLSRYSI